MTRSRPLPSVPGYVGLALLGAALLLGACGGSDESPDTRIETTPEPIARGCAGNTSPLAAIDVQVDANAGEVHALYTGNSWNQPCAVVVAPDGSAEVEIASPNGAQPTDIRQWCARASFDPDTLKVDEREAPEGTLPSQAPAYGAPGSNGTGQSSDVRDECRTVPIRTG